MRPVASLPPLSHPQRSNADKRRDVLALLRDPAWSQQSDRAIAQEAGVDHKTVSKCRKQLCGEIPQPEHMVQRGHTIDARPLPPRQSQLATAPLPPLSGAMLVSAGLSLAAAQRVWACLQALPQGQRQEAERWVRALLL